MVLGSHQFSRHANQRTHGSRTHRLGRRHFTCATTPLWHRPIYRQWGISPRPETAIASVAPVGFRASMPRVIYGGGKRSRNAAGTEQRDNNVPAHPKVLRFSRQSRETAKGKSHRNNHVPHPSQSNAPFAQSAKQRRGHVSLSTTPLSASRPQGRKRRESGGGTGTSLRNIPQDAKRLRSAKRDAEPLYMSEDVPERNPVPPPDSRWEF